MEIRKSAQEVEMVLAPGGNLVKIVAGRDRRTSHQEQYLLERIHHPPGFAAIVEVGKMPKKYRKPCARGIWVDDRGHEGAPEPPRNHGPRVNTKSARQPR